jgi:hypothetical protein
MTGMISRPPETARLPFWLEEVIASPDQVQKANTGGQKSSCRSTMIRATFESMDAIMADFVCAAK